MYSKTKTTLSFSINTVNALQNKQGIIFVSSGNGDTINSAVAISFLPGGYRNNNNGNYNNMGNNGYFWSATESGDNAWKRNLNYNNTTVKRKNNNKS